MVTLLIITIFIAVLGVIDGGIIAASTYPHNHYREEHLPMSPNKIIRVYSGDYPLDITQIGRDIALARAAQQIWGSRASADDEDPDHPFYVVDLSRLVGRYDEWREKLPHFRPHYAIKANNDPVVVEVLAVLGSDFDCASRGEIEQVLALKVNTNRILYTNPNKARAFVQYAGLKGVRRTVYDSEEELEKIKLYYHHGSLKNDAHPPELLLRIRIPDATAQLHLDHFGCDPTEDRDLLEKAHARGLEVVGIAFHIGSGAQDPGAFGRAIEEAHKLFEEGEKWHRMRVLDVGGGFPGVDKPEKISFDQTVSAINKALNDHFVTSTDGKPMFHGREVELIAEPGRYFASSTSTLFVNVIGAKEVAFKDLEEWARNSNPNPLLPEENPVKKEMPPSAHQGHSITTFNAGRVYFTNSGIFSQFMLRLVDPVLDYEAEVLFDRVGSASRSGNDHPSIVCGPTCAGIDRLHSAIKWMPQLKVGDWLKYENMGDYSRVLASEFNGIPQPLVYYVADEKSWARFGGASGGKGGKEVKGGLPHIAKRVLAHLDKAVSSWLGGAKKSKNRGKVDKGKGSVVGASVVEN